MDHFRRSGLRFDVLDRGGPAEHTVVLLHGFPQQPSTFDAVAARLHDQGLRTLVPSQRGYRPGARPAARRDYRTTETVGDVLALLDAAGLDRAHVVGHDWGGFQAWALAAWYPDRVASATVLSTPHPAALTRALAVSDQALRSAYLAFFQLPRLPEAYLARTLRATLTKSRLPARHVEDYCRTMAESAARTGALSWYRGVPFSSRPVVGPVTVATTYVWGRHDFALGRAAAERTQRYVQAPYEFRELNSGHWLPEAEPAAVAEAVLDQVAGSAVT